MELVAVKPIVSIQDAIIIGSRMYGYPVNHPNLAHQGKQVVTSYILKVENDRVETENTVYNVLNWG